MLHQIGIGALGPVFRTYEPTRDRLIAVKVFRLDIVPEQAQALADALSRATESSLFHPSIVEPIAAGVEGTLAYRAEEYVAAESLDVAMRHYAPARLEKALPFITQLAGAIDFARAAGVGHGGLHPRDIFVTPDEARATGFGVVEALERVGIRAPIRRPYSAPERINGEPWGIAADIFSLAAIAFELLTSRRPSGTGAQIGALAEGDQKAALHAVLARAMDEQPSKRYPTALAFAAALEAAGRGESVPGPAVSASPVPAPPPVSAPPPAPRAVVPAVAAPSTPAPPVPPPAAIVPPPGEFEVEKQLDPLGMALEDEAAAERDADEAEIADRMLFDDEETPVDARDRAAAKALADAGDDARAGSDDDMIYGAPETEAFADEFVEEQASQAESRRPLEASHETVLAEYAPEEPAFAATSDDSEGHVHDAADRSRPAILPIAVTLVIGLLAGFGAGYFVGSRDRLPPQVAAPAPVTAQATPPAPGVATPDKPGQYSEQKVTPAPAAAAPEPPPVTRESPAPRGTPAAAVPPATRGRLVVRSTPARAAVTVNGTWRGRTPLTLDGLPFGRYAIRVVQPGFQVARGDVTLSAADASHEFAPQLQAEPRTPPPARAAPAVPPSRPTAPEVFTGSLFVDSRPRGATVFIDDRSVGQTPLSLPDVRIGSHVVRLELAGKRSWTALTRVVAGQTVRVTGSLEDR